MTDSNTPLSHLQSARRRGLGRGLDALFDGAPKTGNAPQGTGGTVLPPVDDSGVSAVSSDQDAQTQHAESAAGGGRAAVTTTAASRTLLSITALRPGTYQPRHAFHDESLDALARSIAQHGIIQPLLVRPLPDFPGMYEIIAGERRWRAAQRAMLHDVPVIINDHMSDREALELGLIENLQREDLNPLDEARGYQRLMQEFHFTPERLGEVIGKSRAHVANMIRLLQLPDNVQAFVVSGDLSAGHARALIGVPDPVAAAQDIIARGLSVRATEKLAEELRASSGKLSSKSKKGKKAAPVQEMHVKEAEDRLTDSLGLKVSVVLQNKGRDVTAGYVRIDFKDLDQLDLIFDMIQAGPSKRRF